MPNPSKTTLLLSLALLIILLGAGYILSTNTKQSSELSANPTATPITTAPQSPETEASASPTGGTYTDYHPGIIEQTSGTKVLFFHAPWCPQCRALEASIKAGTIPANTTIIKVDYDSNQALRKTYGVTLQTSLVRVDDSGTLVKKFVAYDDPSLDALIKNVL